MRAAMIAVMIYSLSMMGCGWSKMTCTQRVNVIEKPPYDCPEFEMTFSSEQSRPTIVIGLPRTSGSSAAPTNIPIWPWNARPSMPRA